MTTFWQQLQGFFPAPGSTDRFEKMRAAIGALFGLVIVGSASLLILGATPGTVWLIAPMGASAVLLFAVPASPLAQPWSILGGNIIAALIGVTCAKLIGAPLLAAAVAGAVAIAVMSVLRCLHPPSGAVALTAVLGGPAILALGYQFVLIPVALNSVLMLTTALFYNNATGRRYPHRVAPPAPNVHQTADAAPTARFGMTAEDLDIALARYNQVLDVSRDDLEQILLETERQVYLRRHGVAHCADVMSRDVISVEFGTDLKAAWNLLHQHRLPALPVVDRGRRVIGIVTKADFITHANLVDHTGLGPRLRQFLTPVRQTHSVKPEVAGQIMHKHVKVAQAGQPIVELVTAMSDEGLHAIPVVDEDRKLVGMLTQSDMIAALYENSLQAASIQTQTQTPAAAAANHDARMTG